MKTKIDKEKLKQLVLDGITTEELNSKYDYSNINSMHGMFHGCSKLESIPHLDTSNVTNMSFMFYGCFNIESIPHLDTSNVTNMDGMFHGCSKLESIPHLDTSNVTDTRYMFYDCSKLESMSIDLFLKLDLKEKDHPKINEKYWTLKKLFKKYV